MGDFDPSSLDPYTYNLFKIESNFDPNAVTGSNTGLGQFGPAERKQYGITDPYDPQQNIDALQREKAAHTQVYQSHFGSAPSDGQLYLMHQQGVAGGPALMAADPNTPAWQAVRPYYHSDAVAMRAITGNIPRGSPLYGRDVNAISAGDFSNYWINRFPGGGGTQMAGDVIPGPSSWGTKPHPTPQDRDNYLRSMIWGNGNQNPPPPTPLNPNPQSFLSPAGPSLTAGNAPTAGSSPAPQQEPPSGLHLTPVAQRLRAVLARMQGAQQSGMPNPVAQRLIDVIQKASTPTT